MPSTPILGRNHDLQNVLSAIMDSETPVVTLLGPGGVGKTRLALTAAWQLAETFRDGVAFIQFVDESPAEAWETVAEALGITLPPGSPWLDILGDALANREMLLVLDDCEKVTLAFTELTALLARCPNVTVLATSQDPFLLDIEQEIWLRPLDLPEPRSSPEQISTASSIELFTLRARRRDPSFTVDESNAANLAAIVNLLDGLPLAIELAAGQIRHFSPSELLHHLEQSLPSLAGGQRDVPERHRSLLNMTTWSLGLLSPEHRRCFLRLAVLTSDFTPETAFRVMDVSAIDGWEMLTTFADKSLVKRVVVGTPVSPGSPRFFILRTLHAGALYLLQQEPEEYATALLNHAAAFLDIARDAAGDWHGPRYLTALQTLNREHLNFEAILERALSTPRLVAPVLELAEPLFRYVLAQNRESWVLPRLEKILSNVPDGVPDHLRGVAHVAGGWFALHRNQIHRAAWHFREGLRLIDDPSDPAALRGSIGEAFVLRNMEQGGEAGIAVLQDTVLLAQIRPDAWVEHSTTLFSLGIHYYLNGDMEEARKNLDESLGIARAHGDHQMVAMNLMYLARIDCGSMRYPDALEKVQGALPTLEAGGDVSNMLLGLDTAAMVIEGMGDSARARKVAIAARNIRDRLHIPRLVEEQESIDATLHSLVASPDGQSVPTDDDTPSLGDLIRVVVDWKPETSPVRPSSPLDDVLSKRELEILHMIATGKTSTEIAGELFVSPHTIKRHMANIRAKLGVRSQAAAVAMLQREN